MTWRVWFHRSRAALWAVAWPVTLWQGWANSVALVWFASAYANVVSDWGAAEAADDRELREALARIQAGQEELNGRLDAIRADIEAGAWISSVACCAHSRCAESPDGSRHVEGSGREAIGRPDHIE